MHLYISWTSRRCIFIWNRKILRQTRMQEKQLICVRECIGKTLKHQQVEGMSGVHLHQAYSFSCEQ